MNEAGALARLDASLAEWIGHAWVAYHPGPLARGPWTELLGRAVDRTTRLGRAYFVHRGPSAFRLAVDGPLPELVATAEMPGAGADVLFPSPRAWVPLPTLVWLWRRRVSHAWLFEDGAVSRIPLEELVAELLLRRKIEPRLRRLVPLFAIDDPRAFVRAGAWLRHRRGVAPSERASELRRAPLEPPTRTWRRAVEADARSFRPPGVPTGRPLRVVQYIGSLSPGGAERQLCNLAIGVAACGAESRVRTTYPLDGPLGHYRRLLHDAGVDVAAVGEGSTRDGVVSRPGCAQALRLDLLAEVPLEIRHLVEPLALELAAHPPDVLHCWLDHPNVIGGLAGLVASVPAIVLSTRNSNPTNFPRLYADYLDTWYRVLVASPRVHWIANSHSGARSYAGWLGVPVSAFHVILNGLFGEHFTRPSDALRLEQRKRFEVPGHAPVVAVINRLSEEKQPELMLKVIALLLPDLPDLRVLVAGEGPLEERMRAIVARRGLGRTVRLLGRVEDVDALLCASDVLLLTSTLEGCPNVVLEAQHMGVPVVATAGGGTVDAVVDGRTGFLCGVSDAAGLALALRRLLADASLRARFGRDAQRFVDACFSTDQMVELTRRVYAQALGDAHGTRVVTPRPGLPSLGGDADDGDAWLGRELWLAREARRRDAGGGAASDHE